MGKLRLRKVKEYAQIYTTSCGDRHSLNTHFFFRFQYLCLCPTPASWAEKRLISFPEPRSRCHSVSQQSPGQNVPVGVPDLGWVVWPLWALVSHVDEVGIIHSNSPCRVVNVRWKQMCRSTLPLSRTLLVVEQSALSCPVSSLSSSPLCAIGDLWENIDPQTFWAWTDEDLTLRSRGESFTIPFRAWSFWGRMGENPSKRPNFLLCQHKKGRKQFFYSGPG